MSKAVILHRISKNYVFSHHHKPTLVESLIAPQRTENYWALKDINLTINRGDRLGLIGQNGAGKTTLLEIITGITHPTSGTITTHGRVVSLIELDAGFHPELTGRENIDLNALLIGMTKAEISSQTPAIIAFADLGRFIDAPLYTYSTGMILRLGFSIAIHAHPDILILDEHLSVGDKAFVDKSRRKIDTILQDPQKSLIFASHRLDLIKAICTQVVCLHQGRLIASGSFQIVSQAYAKITHP